MSELSADIVRIAYRLFFDREPESDSVVEEKANACGAYRELRELFVSSPEFGSLINLEINRRYWEQPAPVEVEVSHAILETLMSRVRDQWRKLGENEPYWSVLSHDELLTQNINAEKLAAFYETGQSSAQLIDIFQKRTDASVSRGTCFELGCGVGRVTPHLAKRFDRVIAADISPGNLALCERHMRQEGIENVETMLLESPETLLELSSFDFFYSLITLQHNPPPIQKILLENILGKIAPGGACLFQTPSTLPNYSFSASAYLEATEHVIDMHCLPKPTVLKLLGDHGLQVRDVELDPWAGAFGSYTYFATK